MQRGRGNLLAGFVWCRDYGLASYRQGECSRVIPKAPSVRRLFEDSSCDAHARRVVWITETRFVCSGYSDVVVYAVAPVEVSLGKVLQWAVEVIISSGVGQRCTVSRPRDWRPDYNPRSGIRIASFITLGKHRSDIPGAHIHPSLCHD
jgi:hypothetical protein